MSRMRTRRWRAAWRRAGRWKAKWATGSMATGRAGFAIPRAAAGGCRSEEHTSELQSRGHLVCRLLLEKKKKKKYKLRMQKVHKQMITRQHTKTDSEQCTKTNAIQTSYAQHTTVD